MLGITSRRLKYAFFGIISAVLLSTGPAVYATGGSSGSTTWAYDESTRTIRFSGNGSTGSYSEYANPWVKTVTSSVSSNVTAASVIKIAEAELGYIEKASNEHLDEKRINSGNKNYTRYSRDKFPSLQPNPWCDMFVTWCVWKASGKSESTANKVLCGGVDSAYTPTSAQYYKNAGRWTTTDAKVGDQVFFKNSQRICHTAIVYKVTDEAIFTIEGNTLNGKETSENGGEVLRKSYVRGYERIAGFGHPVYNVKGPQQEELTINKVVFNEGVTKIGAYAFNHRTDVTSVTIPRSVKEIATCAFSYCSGIKDVYYGGSKAEWKKLDIPSGNYYIENANIHYAITTPTKTGSGSSTSTATQTSVPSVKAIALKITSQPSSKTVKADTLNKFRVASNASSASYQWQVSENSGKSWRDFTEKLTAKTQELYFTVTAKMNGWKFRCKVSNGSDSVYSTPFTVTVQNKLRITKQPTDQTAAKGQVVKFKTKANKPASFQWQYQEPGKKWRKVVYQTGKTKNCMFHLRGKMDHWKFRCKVTSGNETVYTKTVTSTVKRSRENVNG